MGDKSCQWILEEAAAGEVFAAGHGEVGNDFPLLMAVARAEPADGGYKIFGHKIFGSLTPVWTRLGLHAIDTSDANNPKIVHAFMPRDATGYRIEETWDTLGMRATRSDDTIFDGAFIPDKYIPRVVPAGLAGADAFVLGVFGWAEPTFGSIYIGIAERALELAVADAKKKTSVAMGGRSMAYNPMLQWEIAEMAVELDSIIAHVERVADDWSNGVDHGGLWPAKLVSAKYKAVEGAKRIVDLAMDISGGGGMFKRNELERMYRDVRAGGFHPANSALVHELVGKSYLGVLGEEPRWG
jgi:alkylation response protein AidB-like acyl-CoA dehydrogenase